MQQFENRQDGIFPYWLVLVVSLLILLILSACQRKPQMDVSVITPLPPTIIPEQSKTDPQVAVVLTEQVPMETAVSPTTTPQVTPEGISCQPPEGWLSYKVQSGDTLFALSQFTGIPVDAIKSANCLLDDFLEIGQVLYLASLPPTRLPPPPPFPVIPSSVQIAESCPPILDCSVNRSKSLPRPFGQPDDIIPCEDDMSEFPDVEFEPEIVAFDFGDAYRGSRVYFFACYFDQPTDWSITLQTATGDVYQLIEDPLLPDDKMKLVNEGFPQKIWAWDVLCDVDLENYRLTVTANENLTNTASYTGSVKSREQPTILVAPEKATPGTLFKIYYCDFDTHPEPKIEIGLYYGFEEYNEKDDQLYYFATDWPVVIEDNGSGYSEILSLPTDPTRDYAIYYHEGDYELKTYFSLVPEE